MRKAHIIFSNRLLRSPSNLHLQNQLLPFQLGSLVSKKGRMADSSHNSPSRMLSLSKERATLSNLKSDEKVLSEEHGPKPSEVYGFVGSISTVVTTAIFLAWAYIPQPWLHFLGITYYPSRYWAVAVPTFAMVTIVFAIGFYLGLNFIITPPPTSLNTIFDEYGSEPSSTLVASGEEGIELPIDPISDIAVNQINDLMFRRPLERQKE